MTVSESQNRTLEEQASAWLVRVSASDVSDQDIEDLTLWLEQSEAHLVAFDRAEALWSAADSLSEPPPRPSAEVVDLQTFSAYAKTSAVPARKRLANGRFWGMAGALAAGLAGAFVMAHLFFPSVTTVIYETAKGQQKQIVLSEGTHLTLNGDTRISVSMSSKMRQVSLEQGELALSVVHDAKRPFSVITGDSQLRDLGTEFNVLRLGGQIIVTVKAGAVEVMPVKAHADIAADQALHAGDQAVIREGEGEVLRRKVDVKSAYAWQQGQAIYQDEALVDVVADLNRYFKKPLVVDHESGQLRLTAVLNLDSEASVVKRLQAFLPIEASATDKAILLRQRH